MPSDSTTTLATPTLPAGFVTARIVARRSLTPRVEEFRLRMDAAPDREFTAGSHLEFLLDLGAGDEVRHYSICARADRDYTVAVLRDPTGRGGSEQLHAGATVGAELRVRGPRNTFPFAPSGPVYFVAGGIGITPFLSMITEAERLGIDWHLLYLGQDQQQMAFAAELAGHGERITLWESRSLGRANLRELLGGLPQETLVYACGPEAMQQAIRAAADETGHRVTIEDFDSGTASTAGAGPVTADGRTALPFTVELADGSEIPVAADESILDALNQAGFRALSSCKRGTCGTCETPILEGEADHRDSVLSEEERVANETMMICVSRACGDRIVLDL